MVGQTTAGLIVRPQELIYLQQACDAVEHANSVDELKKLMDQAEAYRGYCEKQRLGTKLQNEAAEVKIRAERKAGALLAVMDKNVGSRGKGVRSTDVTAPRLKDLGVKKMQSSRWQRVAKVPDAHFEQHISQTKKSERELTTTGLLKLGKKIEASIVDPVIEQSVVKTSSDRLTDNFDDFINAGERFGCIYADPAWQYGNQATRASTDNHYPTMPLADICALPVKDIAAENAHLHLWTTNAFLFDARTVMEAWGFTYKSVMVWVKPSMGIGNYWRVSHEFLLLGIRGSCPFQARDEMSWVQANREGHSAKPDIFRQKIERVSPGPRIELFSRRSVPGWSAWGNQIEKASRGRAPRLAAVGVGEAIRQSPASLIYWRDSAVG